MNINKERSLSLPNIHQASRRGKEQTERTYFEQLNEELCELGAGRYYHIITHGCQMNVHDTEVIAGLLEEMSYQATSNEEEADLIIVNTCAIRDNAESRVYGEIGRFKKLKETKPGLLVAIAGCMPQEESTVKKILQSYRYVDIIFGTHNIHRLPQLVLEALNRKELLVEVWSQEGNVIEQLPVVRDDQYKAWVNIIYGCDNFCTYCIVPYTRGKERSRKPAEIIQEVERLAANGYQEVTLLGQNVNAYGKDLASSGGFAELLSELQKLPIPRVRFMTSHPKDFDQALIDVLARGGNLVEHVHLPLQSGNNEILKLMGRKYTREQYLNLVKRLKQAIPGVVITTDIIVGFPGETEEQFNDTLTLVREVEFDSAFTFIFSPREGTPAAEMTDDTLDEIKKERLYRLIDLQNEISRKCNELLLGQIVEILVEGESKNNPEQLFGRTRTSKTVNFSGDKSLIGRLINVKITEAKTWSLNGEIL
jgi:tRNA-2-methylthio-N6-dimethylallyladenosine synthase